MSDVTHADLLAMEGRIIDGFRREVDSVKEDMGRRFDSVLTQLSHADGRVTDVEHTVGGHTADLRTLGHDFRNHLNTHGTTPAKGQWVLPAPGTKAFFMIIIGGALFMGIVITASLWAPSLVRSVARTEHVQ